MVRELIQMPFRIAGTVIGGIAGVARSRIGGGSSPPASYAPRPVPSAPTGPAAPAPKRPEPVRPHTEASDWDEDAPVQPGGSAPDDLIVTDRVKTQLFGAVDSPTGEINLNVENGVVFLRGHLEDPEQVEELVVLAGAVEGVVGVENLINR